MHHLWRQGFIFHCGEWPFNTRGNDSPKIMILFSDIRLNENTDPLYAPNNRRSHHDNTTARASYTGIFWNMKQRYELVVRTINVIKRFRKRWNMAKHIIVKWILEWNVFEININFIGNSAFSLVFLISGLLADVILL